MIRDEPADLALRWAKHYEEAGLLDTVQEVSHRRHAIVRAVRDAGLWRLFCCALEGRIVDEVKA